MVSRFKPEVAFASITEYNIVVFAPEVGVLFFEHATILIIIIESRKYFFILKAVDFNLANVIFRNRYKCEMKKNNYKLNESKTLDSNLSCSDKSIF
ncbi:hypothetical protein LBMAG27_02370 [Bacteroidota bacterium]|nr:hypothetical protein LBMAG27_02370 [Bacteroidota bacterium]